MQRCAILEERPSDGNAHGPAGSKGEEHFPRGCPTRNTEPPIETRGERGPERGEQPWVRGEPTVAMDPAGGIGPPQPGLPFVRARTSLCEHEPWRLPHECFQVLALLRRLAPRLR